MTRLRCWCLQSMSVVDTRLLGRPSTFGDAEAEWPDWAFSMRECMEMRSTLPSLVPWRLLHVLLPPVLVTTLGVSEQNVARQLFFMLAMMTKGPALAIVVVEVRMALKLGGSWYDATNQRPRPERWVCCNRS